MKTIFNNYYIKSIAHHLNVDEITIIGELNGGFEFKIY